MNNFDLELQHIQLQNEKAVRKLGEIHTILKQMQNEKSYEKEFYTIEECAKLKGGAALNTYKANRFLLPGCGNPRYSVFIAGRLCFPKDEVIRWLKVSDENYLDYAASCGIHTVPEKYLRLSQKARAKSTFGHKLSKS